MRKWRRAGWTRCSSVGTPTTTARSVVTSLTLQQPGCENESNRPAIGPQQDIVPLIGGSMFNGNRAIIVVMLAVTGGTVRSVEETGALRETGTVGGIMPVTGSTVRNLMIAAAWLFV